MDLGGLLGNLAGQYIQTRFGTPQQPPVFNSGNLPLGTMPPVVIDQGGGACAVPSGYRWSDKAGGYVKKTRRRRKRLATASDLRDLASLKGVLGQGDAFKVWIATHS